MSPGLSLCWLLNILWCGCHDQASTSALSCQHPHLLDPNASSRDTLQWAGSLISYITDHTVWLIQMQCDIRMVICPWYNGVLLLMEQLMVYLHCSSNIRANTVLQLCPWIQVKGMDDIWINILERVYSTFSNPITTLLNGFEWAYTLRSKYCLQLFVEAGER